MVRERVNNQHQNSAVQRISKRELFQAYDSFLTMQNVTNPADDKPRDVRNSTSRTESAASTLPVGGTTTSTTSVTTTTSENKNTYPTKPVYIPEKVSSQNNRIKRIPEGEELANVIVKDEDQIKERDSVSVDKSKLSKSDSRVSASTISKINLEEKSGRKLQSLEQEDDNLGFDEVDFGKSKRLGKDEVDSKSIWSEISYYMKKDFRYYFQHPFARLFVAYFVTLCNFLIFAEDPVAHSRKFCEIPVVGNVYALVIGFYPPNAWSLAKVAVWLIGIVVGMIIGKLVVHRFLFGRVMRLRMFRDDQGSWMTMFLTVLFVLFIVSFLLNALYLIGGDALEEYKITSNMGIENSTFMKAAACGTWMGDFVTAWMVTDMMLQDKLYPGWAVRLRAFWKRGYTRIILFWVVWLIMTLIVVLIITTDWVNWDTINRDLLVSNEVSRAFLASFILVMDLLIVMQDWDFPHFESSFDIKLPGLNTSQFNFELPACLRREEWRVHITGKWFNYGIIFLVMILDLNMWKNQIFYDPYTYGQYTDMEGRVVTVMDDVSLLTHNETLMTYDWRKNNINPLTNRTYYQDDLVTNSRYYDFSLVIKATAFVPSIATFVVFGVFIWWYGRFQPDPNDPHAGRLFKRKKKKKKDNVKLTTVKTLDVDRNIAAGHTNHGAEVGEGVI
ncbi:transmembrane protein 117-like [Ptychodera flava]|uniref:transmembrane protein 117-like n=1 Tax=Ptychodera flava TaxID=63121 RepID=UPI00396A4008